MKRWFDRLPIHRKLVASALLITAAALLLALLGLSAFDVWRHRAGAADDAKALAQVLAENTAAAVMFREEEAARDLLRSVRVRTVVTRACIFLPDGTLFVGFSAKRTCPSVLGPGETWDGAIGSALITRNGRSHGSVYVERDLSDLQGRLLLTALAGLLTFAFAASAAYLLAQRVNTVISHPITALAQFARDFGNSPEAISPTVRTSPDEIGDLVAAFSDMVTRVRASGDQLRYSHDALLREKAEREAATGRQRESELRFRTLADGSPVLLWVNGPEGCEFVNRAYLDFVGLASDVELKGYDWSRYVHPDDREAYLEAYLAAYGDQKPFHAEFRFRRGSPGEWRWMRSEATPRIEHDKFVGYVGASVDITERRRAEEALVEADRRKDTFLAILAHELRNPLAPIGTGLELLRVSEDKPGAIARMQPLLERQIGHMVRLIDDLLDVSRITSGKILLQRQPCSLRELVQTAVDASRAAIDDAGLRISVELPDTPVTVDVDPTRFVQVLSNLLHNATKFTDRGGSIVIRAIVDESAVLPLLTLTVADSGIGIPPAMLSKVFDLFTQVEGAGRAKSGLGIGLALAKQLIEMHEGTLEAHSEGLNQGSAFIIRMPAQSWDAVSEPPGTWDVQRCAGVRVLVIDDNVDAADMLAALVTSLGGEGRVAYDGPAGVRAAAALRPDVVLLDIGMPDMDGYETCRRLRAASDGEPILIVAVTGWGQPQDRERALAEGFDAHITKPADPRVLEKLLAEAPRASI